MLTNRRVVSGLSLVLALGVAQSAALGQCGPRWVKDTAFSQVGADFKSRSVGAMVTWDPDGAGPQQPRLVVVVRGTLPNGITESRVYQWLDESWSRLPDLPSGFQTQAFAAMPDGRLFVGGWNQTADPARLKNLAQLVNGAWVDVGGGVSGTSNSYNDVFDLQPLADGRLLVAGGFTVAGSTTVNHIAIWNGATWEALGGGTNGDVRSVAQLANGDIIAGGLFNRADGIITYAIARYRNGQWSPVSGPRLPLTVCAVADLGENQFAISGPFYLLGSTSVSGVGRFDGANWNAVGKDLMPLHSYNNATIIWDMITTTTGDLLLCGDFGLYGKSTRFLARWDGVAWRGIGAVGPNERTWRAENMPDGSVAVAGAFTSVDGMPVNGLARFTYAPCPGDFNNDCFLSFEDADAMIDAFIAGNPSADFDADGMLTWADVDAFIAAFDAGC